MQPDLSSLYNEFVNNPVQFLSKNKYNIPDTVENNPRSIIQYLLSSGQLSQQQLFKVQGMIPQLQKIMR